MRYFLILMLCLFAVGCTKYYKIIDPTTHKIYYTTKINKKKSGAINIQDERTGNQVTLQSSEIEKVSKNQFNLGVFSTGSEATQ
jgi:hypothetical protein